MPRKVSINSIKNLVQFRNRIKPEAVEADLVKSLAEEGKRLMQLAYASRGFENRTKNLKDSYCCGVYYKGKLIDGTVSFLSREPEAEKTNRGWIGRVEAEAFLESVGKQISRKGYSLVIGVGLFYGGILESRGYRVLANIEMDLRDLAKYGVKGYKYKARYSPDAEGSVVYRVDKKI